MPWWIGTRVTLSHLKKLKLFIILKLLTTKFMDIYFHLVSPPYLSSSRNENKDRSKFIKPECGKFYWVRYELQCERGGTTIKVLPAMCKKNDLEEHLDFCSVSQMIYLYIYSRVPNNCPPRLLTSRFFSTQDIFIPTPPIINFQSFLLTFLGENSNFHHSPS